MAMLIKDLINLPEQVNRGDFVLRLTEGVARPDETVDSYVVTPQLEQSFDAALALIKSAVEGRTSKAAYLHGSFGSGKRDRKSTRLNSSHLGISYAVFC